LVLNDGSEIGPSDPIMGRLITPADPGQKQDPAKVKLRTDEFQFPAVLAPGLRHVSIKGIEAALRAARTLP
jgi:hypothetical protein